MVLYSFLTDNNLPIDEIHIIFLLRIFICMKMIRIRNIVFFTLKTFRQDQHQSILAILVAVVTWTFHRPPKLKISVADPDPVRPSCRIRIRSLLTGSRSDLVLYTI